MPNLEPVRLYGSQTSRLVVSRMSWGNANRSKSVYVLYVHPPRNGECQARAILQASGVSDTRHPLADERLWPAPGLG